MGVPASENLSRANDVVRPPTVETMAGYSSGAAGEISMRALTARILEVVLPRRVTSRGNYLAAIDGLRFVAIAWVVFFHLNGYLTAKTGVMPANIVEHLLVWLFKRGHWGVELFFVISGFILGLPFAAQHTNGGKRISLKRYFARRLTRLEPPYIAAMSLTALLAIVVRGDIVKVVLVHLGAHLLYLHNFAFSTGSLNAVTWSLEVEVQFYLLAPLLALVFKLPSWWRRAVLILAMPIFGTIGYCLFLLNADKSLLQYLHLFAGGFLLADLHLHTTQNQTDAAKTTRDLVGLALFLSLPVLFANKLIGALLAPLAITTFYYCVLQGNLLRRAFSSLVVSRIGGMCYSMYLLHFLVISAVGRLVIGHSMSSYTFGLLMVAGVCLPAILASTVVFFRIIELPCMYPDWAARLVALLRRGSERL